MTLFWLFNNAIAQEPTLRGILKISVENGRWGPFVRFNKKMLKLTGKKYTSEEAALLSLEDIKAMIASQVPGAFEKKDKKAAAPKKAATKKTTTKKVSKKK